MWARSSLALRRCRLGSALVAVTGIGAGSESGGWQRACGRRWRRRCRGRTATGALRSQRFVGRLHHGRRARLVRRSGLPCASDSFPGSPSLRARAPLPRVGRTPTAPCCLLKCGERRGRLRRAPAPEAHAEEGYWQCGGGGGGGSSSRLPAAVAVAGVGVVVAAVAAAAAAAVPLPLLVVGPGGGGRRPRQSRGHGNGSSWPAVSGVREGAQSRGWKAGSELQCCNGAGAGGRNAATAFK
jgi:hypothetical protein